VTKFLSKAVKTADARVKKSLPITPKFKSDSATTDSAKNRQSYLKSCYSIFKFASPHPKVISDFLYEEELLNLRIQTPVCSDTGGNDFLTPAWGQPNWVPRRGQDSGANTVGNSFGSSTLSVCSVTVNCRVRATLSAWSILATSTATSTSSCPPFQRLVSDGSLFDDGDESAVMLRSIQDRSTTKWKRQHYHNSLIRRAGPMTFNPSSAVYQPPANCPLSEAILLSTPKGTILTKTGSPAVHWFITELSPKGCSVWRPVLKDSPQETGMKDASGKVLLLCNSKESKEIRCCLPQCRPCFRNQVLERVFP
jgi:hypothetical protein